MNVYSTGLIPLVPPKIVDVDQDSSLPPVKIVYLLTIAGRGSRQVRRLIRQIYSPQHYIFVHVDARWDTKQIPSTYPFYRVK